MSDLPISELRKEWKRLGLWDALKAMERKREALEQRVEPVCAAHEKRVADRAKYRRWFLATVRIALGALLSWALSHLLSLISSWPKN